MNPNDEFQEFLHHLSDNALQSLKHADAIARAAGSAYVGTEHLMLGVLAQQSSTGAKLLIDNGVTLERARLAMNLKPKTIVLNMGAKGLSEAAKLTLKMSWEVAQEYAQDLCGTEHIVYSILSQKNASATVLLKNMNIRTEEILMELEHLLNRQNYESSDPSVIKRRRKGKKTLLDQYSTDLTLQAKEGKLDAWLLF